MSTLTVRQTMVLVALFVITSIGLIGLDHQSFLDPFKSSLRGAVAPVVAGLNGIGESDPSEAEAELAAIRAERDALRVENIRLRDVEKENAQLRAQVDIEEDHQQLTLLSARVLSVDSVPIEKSIILDKGYDNGIRRGMAVIDPNNYVGQVVEVWATTSKVMLLINTGQQIAVRLADSGATGTMEGRWQAGGRAQMVLFDTDVVPVEGEKIVTVGGAGGTAGIPSGLLVGQVGPDPEVDEQAGSLVLPILPYADFDNLKVVTVVISQDSSTDAVPSEGTDPTGDTGG